VKVIIMKVSRLLINIKWKKAHKLLLLLLIPVVYFQWTTLALLRRPQFSSKVVVECSNQTDANNPILIVDPAVDSTKTLSESPEEGKKENLQEIILEYIRTHHLTQYDPDAPTDFTGFEGSDNKLKEKRTPKLVAKYFKFKKNGFFVELGGINTYLLERLFTWTGLVFERDPALLSALKKRNRNVWITDACLSKESVLIRDELTIQNHANKTFPSQANNVSQEDGGDGGLPSLECFSLSLMMAAINQKRIDYLSLNVEGNELDVLETLPFNTIPIKLISVGVGPENQQKNPRLFGDCGLCTNQRN